MSRLEKFKERITEESVFIYVTNYSLPQKFKHLKELSFDAFSKALQEMPENELCSLYGAALSKPTHKPTREGHSPHIPTILTQKMENAESRRKALQHYTSLFAADASREQWSDTHWELRLEYKLTLENLEKMGGCSGCQKAALTRRYVKQAMELDQK